MIETQAHKDLTRKVWDGMTEKEREQANGFAAMLVLIKEIEILVKRMDGNKYD